MNSPKSDKYSRLLPYILWLTAIVYLINFDLRGIWTDEGQRLMIVNGGRTASSALSGQPLATTAEVLNAIGPLAHQPGFYVMANFLFQINSRISLDVVRLFNLLFLALALAALLRVFSDWDTRARCILAVLFSLNAYLMMHVFQFREYPLYLAASLWSIHFFLAIYRSSSADETVAPRDIAGYVLSSLVGYYATNFFLLLLLSQALFSFWPGRFQLRLLKAMVIAGLGMFIGALPWLLFVRSRFPGRSDPGRWATATPPQISEFFAAARKGFSMILSPSIQAGIDFPGLGLSSTVLWLFTVLALLAIITSFARIVRNPRNSDYRSVFSLLTILVFFAFQGYWYFMKDQLSVWPRYFLGHYFGITVLVASGINWFLDYADSRKTVAWRGLGVLVIALVSLAGIAQAYVFNRYPYEDTGLWKGCEWREVSERLNTFVQPEDALAYYHPLLAWTLSENFRVPATEIYYNQIIDGSFARKRVVWVLDSHVEQDALRKAQSLLESYGYRRSSNHKLGCLADLMRYEIGGERANSTSVPSEPDKSALVFEAERFSAGNTVADFKQWGLEIGVAVSPKYPAWAEYKVDLPKPGRYQVWSRYASGDQRPLSLSIDGKLTAPSFAGERTGGFTPENQKWHFEGEYEIKAKSALIRLSSNGPFPCLDKLALVAR